MTLLLTLAVLTYFLSLGWLYVSALNPPERPGESDEEFLLRSGMIAESDVEEFRRAEGDNQP
jgi:hypothetical protein